MVISKTRSTNIGKKSVTLQCSNRALKQATKQCKVKDDDQGPPSRPFLKKKEKKKTFPAMHIGLKKKIQDFMGILIMVILSKIGVKRCINPNSMNINLEEGKEAQEVIFAAFELCICVYNLQVFDMTLRI